MKKLLALLLTVGFTGAVMAQQAQPASPTTEQKQEEKREHKHKKEEKKAQKKEQKKEHKEEEKKETTPAEQKK